ncbi:type IV inositol polyphosphate 5-phosphatase 9-like [Rhodamnia argentea]|uniref:Type IV inositol polyphosphate 5-phosphatase 9-like n=1 Tax=Rhodamnia argentea TaxID=178133 RepID=A0A8B8P3B4_9MYRT|nr:type IV inositol polyphosphate 5-phosphatase 9-like [Rhodamnia argentea]
MWPKRVANKILGKRFGTNNNSNFVADLPRLDMETALVPEVPSLEQLSSYYDDKTLLDHRKQTHEYKIFVSTWNVGGVTPGVDLSMEDWLDLRDNACDIYVLGFQEVVPLTASAVLGSENATIRTKWNAVIGKSLNRTRHEQDRFHCMMSKQMVGLLVTIWVRGGLLAHITHPSASCVGCGVMGCLGNKGAVSVRFELYETSFCFVCTHLASGDRQADHELRNSNAAQILSRTSFPGGPSLNSPRKILDHDRVILLGDLNCRISLPEATTRSLVERSEWSKLLKHDQLKAELRNGRVLQGWQEGRIDFVPTYKYCPNSDVYYGSGQENIKGEGRRVPAWCDRIIWYGEGLKQHLYTRGESKLSDHRPVKAIFTAQVSVSTKLEGLWSFLTSQSFERIKNVSADEILDSTARRAFKFCSVD